MIVKNYFGTSLDFLPKEVMTRGLSTHINSYKELVSYKNIIYLMTGSMPETNELYEINDVTEFEATYGSDIVTKIDGIDLAYHYDTAKKERIIKKGWKDALDFTYNVDGTISWFAVKLSELEEPFVKAESIECIDAVPCEDFSINDLDTPPHDNISFLNLARLGITKYTVMDIIFTFSKPELLTQFLFMEYSYISEFFVYLSNDKTNWLEVDYQSTDSNGLLHTKRLNNHNDTTKYKYAKVRVVNRNNGAGYISFAGFKRQVDEDHTLIFSDSIGVWEDTDRVIITETLSGTQGSPNIFKDFTLAMRDTCNLEIAAEPTVEYTDNDAGIIIINAISDNIITNPERLQDLIIDGTTIGIENGQEIEAYLNGARYVTNVVDSIWSITVPAEDVSVLTYDTTYNVKVDCRDRAGNLGTSNRDVFVKAENVAPVITVVSTLTVLEDSSTEIAVSFSDTDGSIVSKSVSALNGTVVYNEDTNIITYAPNNNFNGSDTISISVIDDLNAETIATISTTVTSVNDIATLIIAESVTTDEDTLITIPYTATDIDGTIVSVTATVGNGTVSVDMDNNTIAYTPSLNFNGGDTIVVTATDDEGLEVIKNISVVVNAINDAPVIAISDTTTNEDTLVNIPYTASDIEGGIVITVNGTNGVAVVDLTNNQIVFTPDNNYVGTASFDVTVTDSEDAFITKTVNVEVTSVNDNPILVMTTVYTMNENTSEVISYSTSDIDGTVDSVTTTTSQNATIVVDMVAETITYTPDAEFIGNDSFTVTATDNEGGTDEKIITITVENVDAPATITVDSLVLTDEETALEIPFTFDDIDGDVVAVASALNGSTTILDGVITYTPTMDFFGDDTITLSGTDELGGVTSTTITVTVANINDDSIFVVAENISLVENTSIEIPFTVTDVDGSITGTTVSALNGSTTILDGVITYTPTEDYEGSDTITLEATDIDSNVTSTTIPVTVTHFDNSAVITVEANVSVDEDSSIVIPYTASDEDGTITTTVSATEGDVTIDATDITYTPSANFNGTTTITLTVTDSVGGVTTSDITVTVGNIDDVATFTIEANVSLDENTSLDIPYTVTDIDGDIVDTTVSALNAIVTVSEGVITYTPTADYEGSDTITLTVTDSKGGVTNTTVSVTVNHVDTPSVITITSGVIMDENTSLDITFTATDADGTITGQTVTASNGSVTTTADTISYTPTTDFVGDDTIVLTVTDSDGVETIENITVTVNNVDENTPAEVTLIETLTVAPDSLTDIDYTATDVDDDTLTITVTNSENGSVSINTENKRISYDAPSVAGTDTITLTVNDGTVDTIKTISVTIEA